MEGKNKGVAGQAKKAEGDLTGPSRKGLGRVSMVQSAAARKRGEAR